jgi:chromosome segregation protein
MTGIVGPNGCGKSNTADAIRWVLGEQSAKSMRGSKMPDIIFAGTTKRKALNICEVSITFSNEEGILPIDYNEVEITRRLHRSGESEYFINNQPCRLKDIHDLLMNTGVGKNSFAIFEQGKIDQVIYQNPIERRSIFEEAAGILKFLMEKQRSMRKLEQVDLNMSRVRDIHQEVEKQIIVKEKQVEKAKAFKGNRADYEYTDKALMHNRWERFEKRKQSADEKKREAQEKQFQANERLKRHHQQLQEQKEWLELAQRNLKAHHENVYKARNEKELKIRERQNYELRLQELAKKEQQWRQDLQALVVKREEREAEEKRLKVTLQEMEEKLAGLETVTKEQWEQVKQAEQAIGEKRKEQQSAYNEHLRLTREEKQVEGELKQHHIRIEHNQDRIKQFGERREQLARHLQELNDQIVEKEKAVQQSSGGIDEKKRQLKEYEAQVSALKERLYETQVEIEKLSKKKTESEARRKSLQRLRDDMEGFSPGTKKLMQAGSKPGTPIHGKIQGLYELITPEAGAEAAVGAVMKPYTQTLVAKTKEDFDLVIQYAKEQNIKDFSLMCLESLKERQEQGTFTSLLTKVFDSSLSRHFLGDVALAQNPTEALQLVSANPHLEVWTDEGAFVDKRRVVFYITQGETNAFTREAELKTLEKQLAQYEKELTSLQETHQQLKQQQDQVDRARMDLDKNIRQDEMKLVEVNFAFQRAKGDRERTENDQKKIKDEIELAETSLSNNIAHVETLKGKHTQLLKQAEEHHLRAQALQQEVEQRSEAIKTEQHQLKEKENHIQQSIEQHRRVLHAVNVLEVQDLESVQQQKKFEQEIASANATADEIKQKIANEVNQLEGVEKALLEVTQASQELDQKVAEQKQQLDTMEQKADVIREEIKESETLLYQVGLEQTQVDSNLETIVNDLRERYNLSLEQLCQEELKLEISVEEAEKKLRSLRRAMESAGDVNMASIEEFEELKQRYEFLNQQLDDLQVSKTELVEIITKLDTESRKQFEETFEQIRVNFQKNFTILFNGGEADLRFTEAEDVLSAGIEIIAKPPGKQMRSINLMSGGEKCLSAMALLFAIFEVRAAPFCILDEVDAPLDDTNISRFVNVVKQFTDKCQFVIITHNKRTMAICDRLFGVSMEEKGVSKLLTIAFSKEEEMEPVIV